MSKNSAEIEARCLTASFWHQVHEITHTGDAARALALVRRMERLLDCGYRAAFVPKPSRKPTADGPQVALNLRGGAT